MSSKVPDSTVQIQGSENDSLVNVVTKAPLSDFLSRPVLIDSFVWGSVDINTHIDPWSLFLSDSSVREKLASFSRLRATINVEFLVNGTPFHYGLLMASYFPNVVASELPADTEIYRHSQLNHVLINPSSNGSVKISAPYVSDFAWMDLSVADSSHVGVIYINTLSTLRMANVTPTSNVTVSVFAYLTDVELSLTSNIANATFTPQVGKVTSGPGEFGKNPVSSIASAVASAASALTRVPYVAPFAKATEIAAGAVGGVASLFGFAAPINLNPASFMKATIATNFATAVDLDLSRSLALDPKNELSIDTRLVGLDGQDEMSIANIASIPSFVKQVQWSTADAADTVLWWFPVTPCGTSSAAVTGGFYYHDTPAGAISRMFTHWSGSMRYHLQVVCSQYHRGRFRITYIPGAYSGGTFDPSVYNENYSQIVDITDDTDFAFTIAYVARMGYLNSSLWNYNGAITYDPHSHNGCVVISVVNSLVAPLALQNVDINVWMSAGPDIKFAAPRDLPHNASYYTPQTGYSAIDCCSEVSYLDLVPAGDRSDIDLAYYGESIPSLRSLLKRDCFWVRPPVPPTGTGTSVVNQAYATIPRMPLMPGYVPSGHLFYHKTTTGAAYNYTRLIPLTYINGWFLGNKGSIRHKVVLNQAPDRAATNYAIRFDYNSATANSAGLRWFANSTAYPSVNAFASLAYPEFMSLAYGSSAYPDHQVLEAQLPDYNPLLFHTPTDKLRDEEVSTGMLLLHEFQNNGAGTTPGYNFQLPVFTSVGEDYNLIFFRGIPPLYTQTTIPAGNTTYVVPDTLFT